MTGLALATGASSGTGAEWDDQSCGAYAVEHHATPHRDRRWLELKPTVLREFAAAHAAALLAAAAALPPTPRRTVRGDNILVLGPVRQSPSGYRSPPRAHVRSP